MKSQLSKLIQWRIQLQRKKDAGCTVAAEDRKLFHKKDKTQCKK